MDYRILILVITAFLIANCGLERETYIEITDSESFLSSRSSFHSKKISISGILKTNENIVPMLKLNKSGVKDVTTNIKTFSLRIAGAQDSVLDEINLVGDLVEPCLAGRAEIKGSVYVSPIGFLSMHVEHFACE